MRAWYGSGRYWYVVAQPYEAGGAAFGWSEESATWERIGAERVDWSPGQFGLMIELQRIPDDVLRQLPIGPSGAGIA